MDPITQFFGIFLALYGTIAIAFTDCFIEDAGDKAINLYVASAAIGGAMRLLGWI